MRVSAYKYYVYAANDRGRLGWHYSLDFNLPFNDRKWIGGEVTLLVDDSLTAMPSEKGTRFFTPEGKNLSVMGAMDRGLAKIVGPDPQKNTKFPRIHWSKDNVEILQRKLAYLQERLPLFDTKQGAYNWMNREIKALDWVLKLVDSIMGQTTLSDEPLQDV